MDLEELKLKYAKLSEKYNFISFKELNEAFEIDRIERETDCVLREVRKTMMDKVVNYMRFLEMFIYPSQAPANFMFFIKEINSFEKKVIEKIYMEFVELELNSLRLEVGYSEKNEAEAIKKIYRVWNSLKKDLLSVFDFMERNWKSVSNKKEKTYFG